MKSLQKIKAGLSHKIKMELTDLVFRPYDSYRIDWYALTQNFGDILNPVLVNALTGKKPIQISSKTYNKAHYFVIGSILSRATKHTTVWGTGFISENSKCEEEPAKVCAVRGPLTRNILVEQGIECPKIYGDPALLLPMLFYPKVEKKYKLGIIPHYVDRNHPSLDVLKSAHDIKIIDIQDPNPYNFLCHMLSCEKIISSSLHGIIVADAYNISSLWVEFSDKVTGSGFKFRDYYQSVDRDEAKPIDVSNGINIDQIESGFSPYKIQIDLNRLLNSCPLEISLQLPLSERPV